MEEYEAEYDALGEEIDAKMEKLAEKQSRERADVQAEINILRDKQLVAFRAGCKAGSQ